VDQYFSIMQRNPGTHWTEDPGIGEEFPPRRLSESSNPLLGIKSSELFFFENQMIIINHYNNVVYFYEFH